MTVRGLNRKFFRGRNSHTRIQILFKNVFQLGEQPLRRGLRGLDVGLVFQRLERLPFFIVERLWNVDHHVHQLVACSSSLR